MADASRELKRFPRGEGCSECRAKKWYVESGFRYCQNGHRIQSWVEYDATEEDVLGLGQVSRRKTDEQVPEGDDLNTKQRLTGPASRTLFHECLQIILRRQVVWMIEERHHPWALEAIVKDLWDLRLRGCADDDTYTREEVPGPTFHSSQDEISLQDTGALGTEANSWDADGGADWRGPRVMDTLSVCYLGCLLLRLPTTVGDIVSWANTGEMPYKRAYDILPPVAHYKLPMPLVTTFRRLERTGVRRDKIHMNIFDLALMYRTQYRLEFPPVNPSPVWVRFVKQFKLPAEIVQLAGTMLRMMDVKLTFPVQRSRRRIVDLPEICLMAAMVVAVKYFVPFPTQCATPSRIFSRHLPHMDWVKWNNTMGSGLISSQAARHIEPGCIGGETLANLEDATIGSPPIVDRGLGEERQLSQEGQIMETTSSPQHQTSNDPTATTNLHGLHTECISFAVALGGSEQDDWHSRHYHAWRSVDDLPDIVVPFYQLAAINAGLTLDMMVKAADMFEVKVMKWQRNINRSCSEKLATF